MAASTIKRPLTLDNDVDTKSFAAPAYDKTITLTLAKTDSEGDFRT